MTKTPILETKDFVGKEVNICGWVNVRRDHGKLIFIDLRDRSGVVQVVFFPQNSKTVAGQAPSLYKLAGKLRPEWVVRLKGKVKARPEKMVNPDIPTGKVEIEPLELEVLNEAETPPFPIDTDGKGVDEGLRMKYRYLDLRRERMKNNLLYRYRAVKFIRDYLDREGFIEIETPVLTKSTPEGARDFVVPSRLHAGQFYALPQSPQQYKQLLMVAGFEKYFQIARCFRDEDSRANRAFGEFTQLDLEMSFVEQNDILELTEKMFARMIKEVFPDKKISQTPWPRLNYRDVMKEYGKDDPDLRKDKSDLNELAFAWVLNFPLFKEQSQDDFFHGSGKSKYAPSHHMFTAPHPDDIGFLDKDPAKIRGLQHDLVLNGVEVGGGSIRIHDPEIQQKVFDLIGFTKEQKDQFKHMLEAFMYGVPPHGGIAPGIDRLLAGILGEQSLRELMAFPKTGDGRDLLMEAPSEISEEQLKELHIKIKK